jgi:hypothetical protein
VSDDKTQGRADLCQAAGLAFARDALALVRGAESLDDIPPPVMREFLRRLRRGVDLLELFQREERRECVAWT